MSRSDDKPTSCEGGGGDDDDPDSKLPARHEAHDVLSPSPSVEWTQLFSASQVRTQLYREEPKLPRLPMKAATLIGTTSALFLNDLVRRTVETAELKTEDKSNKKSALIKCADVYQTVKEREAFGFVKDSLEANNIDKLIQKEKTRPREYAPRPKRQRTDTSTSGSAKKVMESAGEQSQDYLEDHGVPTVAAIDKIIADEDDYD